MLCTVAYDISRDNTSRNSPALVCSYNRAIWKKHYNARRIDIWTIAYKGPSSEYDAQAILLRLAMNTVIQTNRSDNLRCNNSVALGRGLIIIRCRQIIISIFTLSSNREDMKDETSIKVARYSENNRRNKSLPESINRVSILLT